MHLLATTGTTLDDIAEPVDLAQTPGRMVVLSFTDSDLSAVAAAWQAEADTLPSLRLVALRDLRHPLSVDLWLDGVAAQADVIVVRLLGGMDWWRYGIERLSALARERGIALAVLPGEDRDDPRLAACATLPAGELAVLLRYFREGGHANMRALLRRMAGHAGMALPAPPPAPMPRCGAWLPDRGAIDIDTLMTALAPGRPVVPVVFYRSMLLAADVAPIAALCAALAGHGLAAAPLFVPGLKDADAIAFIRAALARLGPAVIVTTTAFAAGSDAAGTTPLDGPGVPVLQAVIASTRRAAWQAGARGLVAADLAMHVVLPELDGRILAGAMSFKDGTDGDAGFGLSLSTNRPEPDQVALVADRIAALVRLQRTPRADRRIAILMPDYPGAPGRTGYAVGLDVPESVLALLHDLAAAGYAVGDIPVSSRALLDRLDREGAALPLADYRALLRALPDAAAAAIDAAWGDAGTHLLPHHPGERRGPCLDHAGGGTMDPGVRQDDGGVGAAGRGTSQASSPEHRHPGERRGPCLDHSGGGTTDSGLRQDDGGAGAAGEAPHTDAFRFRAVTFGNVTVALAPDRGQSPDRRADYHDPALPPRHALVAFGLWLRHRLGADALVHLGAHGTLEWLPGKAVALTPACFPQAVVGPLPVVYPFIVSNPGEAAQAKRRIAAVTIGHLPPPLATGTLSGPARDLERLVDEYAVADGLDRRRRERLARLIVETAQRSGLAQEAGVARDAEAGDALRRIDAWLCDIKDMAVKDGHHVYGRAAPGADAITIRSATAERAALLAALDGRMVPPGPAGAPARGRRDVLPTGRNLFTADPRTLPTPTATDLGTLAAEEVIRAHLQDHGEMPRAVVIDLWGSAALRTGGEEIAQGLALMGCRPVWDEGTGRVTGVAAISPMELGRSRVDVTWRVSGLFRDLFPAQIALLDAAVRTLAARHETDAESPLAAAMRGSTAPPARIFGGAPGIYGSGVEDLLGTDADRAAIGAAYLDGASHAYAGGDGTGTPAPGGFARAVARADLLVHTGDDPGRDLLEGSADVAFAGGFAAAAASLGRSPAIAMLDTTDPQRPRARSLDKAIARVVRGRAIDPRFIAGQMRHGPRGAAELAETVDRLVAFAETTDAVAGTLIDLVYDAYVADDAVRDFLRQQNPAAAEAIATRLADAIRRGRWHPRRNDVAIGLHSLRRDAA